MDYWLFCGCHYIPPFENIVPPQVEPDSPPQQTTEKCRISNVFYDFGEEVPYIIYLLEASWMAQSDAKVKTSQESKRRGDRSLKKIKDLCQWIDGRILQVGYYKVRLMFQDEAGFGRINKPKYCWCYKGYRPTTPCLHIREYRYAYGAVEPRTGESFYLVLPYCNTDCMNIFLQELSATYPDEFILLVADGASWHKSKALDIPKNIKIIHLPPYTPEMNPIEAIWKEIRKRGFRNEIFQTLEKVVDRLCETIRSLTKADTQSITGSDWIMSIF